MPAIEETFERALAVLSPTSVSARADAELLLGHVVKRERAFLIAHPEYVLTDKESREFQALLERRVNGVPIAYLVGAAWFCGRRFAVNERVLVPRPETEILAQAAIEHLARYEEAMALDVGTGCGAIACTIAAELPNAVLYATERSAAALVVAVGNARCLGLAPGHPECSERASASEVEGPPQRVIFELADLLPVNESLRFDAVIANLPYIPTADIPQEPDPVGWEPRAALDGGPDGLREYRRLLKVLPARMNGGGIALLEAAPPTITRLRDLAARAFPNAKIDVGCDYTGLERYVAVRAGATR